MDEVPAAASKESYHDWSVRELERLLSVALTLAKGQQPLCIFIDGLDEFVDYGGGENLIQKILNLKQFERVKICVASRAEPLLREQLDTVPHLRLHDLTAPEMRQWVQEKFISLETEGKLQSRLSLRLTDMLLQKAEGVFLWIRVATQSVMRGVKNEDSEKVLVSRLEQLPERLEDLYYDMWKRLGEDESIYRTSAATYLRFVIADQSLRKRLKSFAPSFGNLNTMQLACAIQPDFQRELSTIDEDMDYERLRVISDTIESEIRTQCAGLLELRSMDVGAIYSCQMFETPTFAMEANGIVFIHRTAHDFLTDTESGQKILSYSKIPNIDMEFLLTGGYLCFLRLLSNMFNGPFLVRFALKGLTPLSVHQGSDEGMKRVKDLLSIVESFYNAGALHSGFPQWPQPSFLAAIADFWAIFEWAIQDVHTESATACIQSMPWDYLFLTSKNDFWLGLQMLISEGADPCAITSYVAFITSKIHYGMRTTALWDLLYACLMERPADRINDWLGMASTKKAISGMLEKCTRVEHCSFLSPRYSTQDHGDSFTEVVYEELPLSISRGFIYPVLLVNMSYLVEMFINFSSLYDPTARNHHRLTRPELNNSKPDLRFVAVETRGNALKWFRVIDQEPFEDLVNIMGVRIREGHELSHFPEWYERVSLLIGNKNVLQEVEETDVLETSVSGKRLGKCTSEELGLLNSEEL
ncbi:Ff.00g038930.m01.CDS01 [Fusarium sp. VM40]|nr:Ff.00g038930.m01.CDS01 [Fusarium sp. VM40]